MIKSLHSYKIIRAWSCKIFSLESIHTRFPWNTCTLSTTAANTDASEPTLHKPPWELLLWRQDERVRVVQPGEETASGRPYNGLPVPKGWPTGKLGRDVLSGNVVTEQGVMALN